MDSSSSLPGDKESDVPATDSDRVTKKVNHRDLSPQFVQSDVSFKDKVLGVSNIEHDT